MLLVFIASPRTPTCAGIPTSSGTYVHPPHGTLSPFVRRPPTTSSGFRPLLLRGRFPFFTLSSLYFWRLIEGSVNFESPDPLPQVIHRLHFLSPDHHSGELAVLSGEGIINLVADLLEDLGSVDVSTNGIDSHLLDQISYASNIGETVPHRSEGAVIDRGRAAKDVGLRAKGFRALEDRHHTVKVVVVPAKDIHSLTQELCIK